MMVANDGWYMIIIARLGYTMALWKLRLVDIDWSMIDKPRIGSSLSTTKIGLVAEWWLIMVTDFNQCQPSLEWWLRSWSLFWIDQNGQWWLVVANKDYTNHLKWLVDNERLFHGWQCLLENEFRLIYRGWWLDNPGEPRLSTNDTIEAPLRWLDHHCGIDG